jgi:serine/threonine protein kinase
MAQVDFLLANPEKEDFEKGGLDGRLWNSMQDVLQQQVEIFEASIFTQTSATTFELTSYEGPVESERVNWVQCERCATWRRLPQGSEEIAAGASWQCGQPPAEQTRCNKSRKEDWYDSEADVVTKAQIHGAHVGSTESSADRERKQMKHHVKAFVSSTACPDHIDKGVKQRIREAVERGMGKEQGALSTQKKMIHALITECSKEMEAESEAAEAESERARLCLRRDDWFLQIFSSSGKLGDLAFPPTDTWSDYFQSYSQGQQLMPVVCRVLTVSVGITGVLELQESKTRACTLECYTLEHNRSVGVNTELSVTAQDTWLRRGKVNVTELSSATVDTLKSRLELGSPLTRGGGNMFRMATDDLNSYTERMLSSEKLRLELIQKEEAKLEELHYQKTPVEAAIEQTFEKECASHIPWAELENDLQHPGGSGATSTVSKYTWRSQADEGSKMVALKQFAVVSQEDWTSERNQTLKREIHIARSCSGLEHVISFLGITFVDAVVSPKGLGLVYEWKEQNLTQFLLSRGPVVGADMERTMISILLQIAAALEALHLQTPAIIHRDLKPSNVLIEEVAGDTEQFRAFLCDFGSAKAASSLSDATNTGNVGTKVFQAPELATEARITHKCDVYSFGVTAAQLAWGVDVAVLESRLGAPPLTFQCAEDIPVMISDCRESSPQARPDFTAIKLKLWSVLQRYKANSTTDRADIEFIRSANRKAVVFRVLNDTQYARDVLHEGLTAGSPIAPSATAVEHVKMDRFVPKSPYISTTMSEDWALYYFAKQKLVKPYETCLIICIDLDMLPLTCKVHSLNREETRTRLGFGEVAGRVAQNFAASAYEVLLEPAATHPVPLSAITAVYGVQDMLLTENVRLFDKLKEGLKKDGKYMSYKDWSTSVADFKRFGY